MAQVKLHNKGPKVQRDRNLCVQKYRQLTDYFWWRKSVPDERLAGMSPQSIYQLAEDFYNRLPLSAKKKYAGHLGIKRENPTSFGWFVHDLLLYSSRPKIWLVLSAPFRYPRFLKRYNERRAMSSKAPEQMHRERSATIDKAMAEVAKEKPELFRETPEAGK